MTEVRIALVDSDQATAARVLAAITPDHRVPYVDIVATLDDAAQIASSLTLCDEPRDSVEHVAIAKYVAMAGSPLAVFTASPTVAGAIDCLRAGAVGYLSRQAQPTALRAGLGQLLAGAFSIDAAVAGDLARLVASSSVALLPGAAQGLTKRESEVLLLLQRGMTNREIGAALFVSEETIKSHAHSVYRKLGVTGRTGLTNVAG